MLQIELGKLKRRGYGFFGEGFVFGRLNEARYGGVDDGKYNIKKI